MIPHHLLVTALVGAGASPAPSGADVYAMIVHASPLVKGVMLLLLAFSVISWAIILSKYLQVRRAKRSSREFLSLFWSSRSLSAAYNDVLKFQGCPAAELFRVGFQELTRLRMPQKERGGGEEESGEVMPHQFQGVENVNRALRRAMSVESTRLSRHLSFLATTGNTTPFIGLFGTVWGIMTSFQYIGLSGSANLAVVAPGISEALVATAAGLAAAIPAVVFYNYFSNQVRTLEAEMTHFASDFLNLIERDLIKKAGAGR